MKIALANNYYYLRGGSERVLLEDQAALNALGYEVEAFAQFDAKNEPANYARYFPNIADYSLTSGIDLAKAAWNIVYSKSVGKAFAKFLDSYRPDIVHCHNIYGHLTTAVLDEAKRRNIPLVMTVHDLKLVCPSYLGLRQGNPCKSCWHGGYWRCLWWKCHKDSFAASLVYTIEAYSNQLRGKYDSIVRFLCPSQFMQNALIESGIARERIIYHPNALEPTRYHPQFEPGNYILYAGRLSAEKGVLTLIAALKRANIPLHIAGTGPLEEKIKDLVKDCGNNVILEGYRTGMELSELFRNAAFTVIPSEWYENASMSALESFAYGKPVLAADIGGNPELVANGIAGRLFIPKDIKSLSDVAGEMWRNKEELIRMGKHARGLIKNRFSQANRISQLLSIYKELA